MLVLPFALPIEVNEICGELRDLLQTSHHIWFSISINYAHSPLYCSSISSAFVILLQSNLN